MKLFESINIFNSLADYINNQSGLPSKFIQFIAYLTEALVEMLDHSIVMELGHYDSFFKSLKGYILLDSEQKTDNFVEAQIIFVKALCTLMKISDDTNDIGYNMLERTVGF
jgi:hypothetical protein